MTELRYIIMERTPFPGYWLPTPHCWLQEAERATWPRQRTYYERAILTGQPPRRGEATYTYADALALVDTLQQQHDYAEYRLIAGPVAVNHWSRQ